MSRKRLISVLAATALLAGGCNSQLGRSEPGCGYELVTGAIILSAQSVSGAAYVPCINELKPGWDYEHLEAKKGQTRFWISSDRVGHRFLEVTLEESCDYTGATETQSDEAEIPLFVEEDAVDYHVRVTIVPEGNDQTHRTYAAEIASDIGANRIEGRLVQVSLDSLDLPTSERIRLGLEQGHGVMVVGAREYEERTVELHLQPPGESQVEVFPGMDPAEALEEIADPLGDPVYRATWYYPFENGCVTYKFDAEGLGAEQIAREVKTALGFTDLAPLRAWGEQTGYVVP